MKKIILFLIIGLGLINVACTDSFLDRYPKGTWNRSNYSSSDSLDVSILVEAKLSQCYTTLRGWPFLWSAFGMNNYTTPDVEKGSTPSDGGEISQFKSMSYVPSNANLADYYSGCFSTIYLTNEAIALVTSLSDTVMNKNEYLSEALFVRSVMYYRLAQAFGGVPWVDRVLSQTDKTPSRSSRDEIWSSIEKDLVWSIPNLPTRKQLLSSGNSGRATQNAARAVLAKVYMYQQKWSMAFAQTQAIILSTDNDLTTPYTEIFTEAQEYGSESVFEIYCEQKPALQIYLGSQFDQIQGFRGVPNLGWGFNSPSQVLMDAYETGDPRKAASVIHDGDTIESQRFKADAASYKYFNKKALTRVAERTAFGRASGDQGSWVNIRLIRYADVLLMDAEAACEFNNSTEALDKLEMVRARARGGNNTLLPKITTTNQTELRAKIHQERRIELAMEWERFYDLVRWNEAKDVIPGFVIGKHELFPIPQIEIDKSNGVLTQNPGY